MLRTNVSFRQTDNAGLWLCIPSSSLKGPASEKERSPNLFCKRSNIMCINVIFHDRHIQGVLIVEAVRLLSLWHTTDFCRPILSADNIRRHRPTKNPSCDMKIRATGNSRLESEKFPKIPVV